MSKFLINSKFSLIVSIILAICNLSSSTDINCGYGENGNYQGILGYIYQCEVENNPDIETKESATINAFIGTHRDSKSDDSVLGIRAEGKTFKYFPQGMEKIFNNLKVIDFYRVGMVEVHQSDLKAFPDLVVIYLGHNNIEILESGLFDYNPKLQVIAFPYNGIKHIYGNIFDNLSHLSKFWFRGNDCINTEFNSRHEISSAIEYVKDHCAPVTDSVTEESELDDNLLEHSNEYSEYLEEANSEEEADPNGGSRRIAGNLIIIGLVCYSLCAIVCGQI